MVLFELEELAPLGVVLNFWVEDLRLFEALAVEIVVSGGETNFVIGEHEQEETVLAPPHLVVAKWLAKEEICLARCLTKLRVGCPMIASNGTASILPLTILAMTVTVTVIAAMVVPFLL